MNEHTDILPDSPEDAVEAQFAATAVSHLADWDESTQKPKVDVDKFTADEQNLITLEKTRILVMNGIDDDQYIGRQILELRGSEVVFTKWSELLENIKQQMGDKTRFNILVTGLPISGKATTRRALAKGLQGQGDKTLVLDRDYIKQPMQYLLDEGVNIIEDMHGIDQENPNISDLERYDMIIYTVPRELDHIKMIQSRGDVWRNSREKVDLTDGTGTAFDDRWTRLLQSMRSESRAQLAREKWLETDKAILGQLSEKIPVIMLDPVEIIANSYQSN